MKKAGTERSLAEGQEAVLFGFEGAREKTQRHAPLAQLVEHLTLNQGVQGSSP